MTQNAFQQLKQLSEISTLLARFENVEQTLPTVLSLVTRTLHVRGATVISNRSGQVTATGWKAEHTSAARSRLDEAHARTAYGYLTGVRASEEEPEIGAARANGGSSFSSKDLRAGMLVDEPNHFVVLPLVVQGGRIFGALQVEGDVQLDEADLLFVNAVVGQLAIALDRQAVLASKDAIVRASRLHAAERFAELQQTERTQHFLADVSSLLAESLDYRSTLASMLRIAVPFLADVCFIDEAVEHGEVARIDAAHAEADPGLVLSALPLLQDRSGGTLRADALLSWRQPQDEVLATGRSIILPDPSGADNTGDALHALTMNAAGFQSMMIVPLVVRGETLGALTLATRGPKRRYSSSDLDLAEEVARRAAIAVDHGRLHRRTQRAVQARENILHIVSHDLRNPLNTLIVSAALLREGLRSDGGAAMSTKPLEMIQRAVRRMERMIGDLLDTASIDAGRLSVVKELQPLAALVSEAIEVNKPAAARRALQLEARLPEQEIRVPCDRGRILQVLSNLIGNAIRFTHHGGSIKVTAERQQIGVRVAVTDTGAGIESSELHSVFDRHFQAKQATSIGTGLGLYISKGIVQSHGGTLWVESEVGKGSTFSFILPWH